MFLNMTRFNISFLIICLVLFPLSSFADPLNFDKAIDAVTSPYKNFLKDYWIRMIIGLSAIAVMIDYGYHGRVTGASILFSAFVTIVITYFAFTW